MAKRGYKRIGKLERWSQFGLLEREQTHLHGHSGSVTRYAPDTAARCAIIEPYLAAHRTLPDAADELILLNFRIGVSHVRRWLKHYIQHQKNVDFRRRRRSVDEVNMPESIRRTVKGIGSSLPTDSDRPWENPQHQDLLELLQLTALGAHGLVPLEVHGITVPSAAINAFLDWEHLEQVLDATTDAHVEQALVTARESLGQPSPGGAEYRGA
jgi:hypothetical protein